MKRHTKEKRDEYHSGLKLGILSKEEKKFRWK
jgi:hypothetical protein